MKDIFAARFREAREKAGFTQDEIASVCIGRSGGAMNSAAVAQWEKPNGTRPTFENLIAAAKYLNVSIDYLVGITDKSMEAREESGRYDLPPEALRIARRWLQLSLPARDAVRHLLDVMSKSTIK